MFKGGGAATESRCTIISVSIHKSKRKGSRLGMKKEEGGRLDI